MNFNRSSNHTHRLHNLRLFQWNCRGLIHKKGEIQNLIADFDIFVISESWLLSDVHFYFPGFKLFRKNANSSKSGGLCTMVRNNIQAREIPEIISLNGQVDALATLIGSVKDEFLIVSIYKYPFRDNQHHWYTIFSSCSKYKDRLVIMGDFSSHNPSWGCSHLDNSGLCLEANLPIFNLDFLNDGSPTRLTPPDQNVPLT
jgi:hypothetical protein